MKRKQFAWEDQRFSAKDSIPLASKLILPEDQTEAALEISTEAGVFDVGNAQMLEKLKNQQLVKRQRLIDAEREAVDEFNAAKAQLIQSPKSPASPPTAEATEAKPYSLGVYGSDDDSSSASCLFLSKKLWCRRATASTGNFASLDVTGPAWDTPKSEF